MNVCSVTVVAIITCLPASQLSAQENLLAASDRWNISGEDSEFVMERGEPVLKLRGGASLGDFDFENGIISFQVKLSNRPGFVGIQFRASERDAEHIYVRPHRSSEWDAIQYQPIMNGSSTWQLHRGEGYTAPVELLHNEWISVRLEVWDARAELFVGNDHEPVMDIALERGVTSGGIAFTSGFRGSAPAGEIPGSFRRLTVQASNAAETTRSVAARGPDDTFVRSWQVSDPFVVEQLPVTAVPTTVQNWSAIYAEPRGIVNLNRYFSRRQGGMGSAVVARTVIEADRSVVVPLQFDFSDNVSVFLNDKLLFSGTNSWESRYPYYLGALDPEILVDTVWLHLNTGQNELSFVVSEAAFGWGFAARMEQWDRAVVRPAGPTGR